MKEVASVLAYQRTVGVDKRIEELETENNKLLDVINNQDVKIADLEKENAELKDRYNKVDIIGYDALKNLTKATEIIKSFLSLRHDCKDKDCPCESPICETIDERAKQFLKE